MKPLYIFLLVLLSATAIAQNDAAQEGKEHMFNVLMSDIPEKLDEVILHLEKGPWEALAYIEEDGAQTVEDLREAVPDYYHFTQGLLDVKLRNPDDADDYSTEMKLAYTLGNDYKIMLRKPGSVRSNLSWQILYLDKNYLALDMGEVRIFFIHTPLK